MKGLEKLPSIRDFQNSYASLQNDDAAVSAKQLALWSQWARFDPRLAEQWVGHCARHWRQTPSGDLNHALKSHPWPAVAGVLLEQAKRFAIQSAAERQAFALWMHSTLESISPNPSPELFFIATRAFGGNAMREDARLALAPYLDWGYFGRDILVNKAPNGGKTLVPRDVRRRVLEELLKSCQRLRVEDYQAALGGWIGARQAAKDLAKHPRLKAMGQTRGRFYMVTRKRN